MKVFAVIDTNVIVSALLKYPSIPSSILEFAFTGTIVPIFNEDILEEYRTVLMRDKFHLNKEIVDDVVNSLIENGELIHPEHINEFFADPKDAIFYEVVMEKRKTDDAYLITGNIKHFPLKTFVVTPKEMLDIIIENNESENN